MNLYIRQYLEDWHRIDMTTGYITQKVPVGRKLPANKKQMKKRGDATYLLFLVFNPFPCVSPLIIIFYFLLPGRSCPHETDKWEPQPWEEAVTPLFCSGRNCLRKGKWGPGSSPHVRSTCCSCRGSRLSSQPPPTWWLNTIQNSRESDATFWPLQVPHT